MPIHMTKIERTYLRTDSKGVESRWKEHDIVSDQIYWYGFTHQNLRTLSSLEWVEAALNI